MILPPKDDMPFNVEILGDPTDWQLLKRKTVSKRNRGRSADRRKAEAASASD